MVVDFSLITSTVCHIVHIREKWRLFSNDYSVAKCSWQWQDGLFLLVDAYHYLGMLHERPGNGNVERMANILDIH